MKFKLNENLLNEKWYQSDDYNKKLWWSDSYVQFKNFLLNATSEPGSKAFRLVVGEDTYAAANGLDLNHDMMADILKNELYVSVGKEWYTLGIPTVFDFDLNNFELKDVAFRDYKDFCNGKINWDILSIWFSNDIKETDIPRNLSETEFIKYLAEHSPGDYNGRVAIFDGFEVSFYGQEDTSENAFKQTELYRALKSLYKGYR